MNKSESKTNLMSALLKAQQAMGAATKDAANPFFKSKYADYGAVLEAVKGPLNDNGVLMLQPHVVQDGKNYVKTVLILAETGEEYSSMTEIVCAKQNDPQALGSAITYARRYGLQSLPCLPTEDDDGNAASGKTAATQPAKTSGFAGTKVPDAPKPTTTTVSKAATPATKPEEKKADAAKVVASTPVVKSETKAPAKPAVAKTLESGW